MEIKIGIRETSREVVFETSESADEIEKRVAEATSGSDPSLLRFTDDRGRIFLVPSAGLAYLEIGAQEARRIGFVS